MPRFIVGAKRYIYTVSIVSRIDLRNASPFCINDDMLCDISLIGAESENATHQYNR